jgi:catechol 2,3-dioxygenase-like lactoylglutathione lyase family enzyme
MSDKPFLDQLNIVVRDMEKSLAFYRRLGLSIPEKVWSNASGAHHASAGTDNSVAIDFDDPAFAQVWNRGWAGRNDLTGKVVVGFKMPSREAVDIHYSDLTAAGYVGLQSPYDAFWGARYAIIEDPDGIAVGLMSPIDPARKTPPTAA